MYDQLTGKILFSWVETLDGCGSTPSSTVILLTPWDEENGFPMNILLKQQAAEFEGSSVPEFPLPVAVDPANIFEDMTETSFELDTMYFISALYRFSGTFGDTFGMPQTSASPLILSKREISQ